MDVGISIGRWTFAVLSDGREIDLITAEKLKLQEEWEKLATNSLTADERRELKRELWKLAQDLVNEFDTIAVEDASGYRVTGWDTFRRFLKYLARRCGKRLAIVSGANTRRKCYVCRSPLVEGVEGRWACLTCREERVPRHNAARIILRRGYEWLRRQKAARVLEAAPEEWKRRRILVEGRWKKLRKSRRVGVSVGKEPFAVLSDGRRIDDVPLEALAHYLVSEYEFIAVELANWAEGWDTFRDSLRALAGRYRRKLVFIRVDRSRCRVCGGRLVLNGDGLFCAVCRREREPRYNAARAALRRALTAPRGIR